MHQNCSTVSCTFRVLEGLESMAFPIANGTASFFSTKVNERCPDVFILHMVLGPDEYAYPANNSAHTNAIASIALNFAAKAAATFPTNDEIAAKRSEQRRRPRRLAPRGVAYGAALSSHR